MIAPSQLNSDRRGGGRFVVAVVAALTAAPTAFAADLPARTYNKAPVAAVPVASWTGCYAGVNAGYQWGDGNASLALQPSLAAFTAIDPAFAVFNGRYAGSPSSGLGGGQVGCNWQSGSFVLGIETDIDYLGASKTTNRTVVAQASPFLGSVTQKLDWLGTVRGRVGVTPATDWLIYATGGLAYGRTSHSNLFVNASDNPNDGFAGSARDTPVGWTVGAGAEFMVTSNWTVKGEYLYYDLGSTRLVGLPFNQHANGFGADGYYQTKGNLVRVGLNYKFGP